jgi:hypothetical protein
MAQPRLDRAPRQYPPFVTLLRRAARGPSAAPGQTTADEIEAWLLREALREDDMLPLYESLVWRLVAAGLAARSKQRACRHAASAAHRFRMELEPGRRPVR